MVGGASLPVVWCAASLLEGQHACMLVTRSKHAFTLSCTAMPSCGDRPYHTHPCCSYHVHHAAPGPHRLDNRARPAVGRLLALPPRAAVRAPVGAARRPLGARDMRVEPVRVGAGAGAGAALAVRRPPAPPLPRINRLGCGQSHTSTWAGEGGGGQGWWCVSCGRGGFTTWLPRNTPWR